MKKRSEEPLEVPFTVVIDCREKHPYTFQGLRSTAEHGYRPLVVPTVWATLATGDYSLSGYENRVAVERKSISDAYSTLGQHRRRFEAENIRLSRMDNAAIVIEASWVQILNCPPPGSKLRPKSVLATSIAWSQRYKVPWYDMHDRRLSEIFTFRFLERFWMDNHEKNN